MRINGKKDEKILGLEGKSLLTFLLSQIGTYASAEFAGKLKTLNITRSHAGIIRLLTSVPGLSQRELSSMLSILPSRLVVLVDELVEKGLVERRNDPGDRRRHALYLTERGQRMAKSLAEVSRSHALAMTKGLTKEECNTLSDLLSKIVKAQGLTPGIHPGYKNRITDAP